MPEWPRFISDAMLGSLSKWLRILGFDTVYARTMDDHEIARIAMQQQRIILTRDTGLARRKSVESILITSHHTFEQLKEVLTVLVRPAPRSAGSGNQSAGYALRRLPLHPRCAVCNGEVVKTEKRCVLNEVPEHVVLRYDTFFRCANCAKVYWEGSHKRMIDSKLRAVLQELEGTWKNSGRG